MTPRAARLLRGTLLGTIATLVAALSHSWSGGEAPSALALVLGAGFASAVGTVAVGRAGSRMRVTRIAIGVAIAQLAFHLGFSLLGTGATVTASGSHHHAMFSLAADASGAIAQGGLAMWAGHLAAGVVTVLYLRHLERRVWTLLGRLALGVTRSLAVRPWESGDAVLLGAGSASVRAGAQPLRGAIARRGPPASSPA